MSLSTSQETNKSFVIGVAGGSGAGKTTIVNNLIRLLKPQSVLSISHDDYYKAQNQLPIEERKKTNYDHPSSLETELLVKQLKKLTKGESVKKPTYNFIKHTRSDKTETIEPERVIIVEGILILESEKLRSLMDLKVFVQTDADIRVLRRIERDMKKRGRSFDFVVDQYKEFTRPMHLKFVEPSKRYADVIVPEGGANTAALDLLMAQIKQKLN